ncbi:MAG: phosphoribosyltransferase [Thermoprotei archaeon]|nr:MAG: phosphoribosyltransferase [Thermoprotei archaeon]RLE80893.1 MAG: phosphoribosyltransferase [Thermoprotei archaeon]RLF02894.1 MAG: phosphoribosyltransferase [Thermoprotei archaeon]
MARKLKLRIISWNEYLGDVILLGEQIENSGFTPQVIVAVARGGLIPARILSDILNVDLIYTVAVKAYSGVSARSKETRILQGLEKHYVAGKEVLVVDDIVDTGETLTAVLNHIRQLGTKTTKTAVPYIKPWSTIMPDYYVRVVNEWIVFPYEMHETIRDLIKRRSTEQNAFI